MANTDFAPFYTFEEAKIAASTRARKHKTWVSIQQHQEIAHTECFGPEGCVDGYRTIWIVSWTPPRDVDSSDLFSPPSKEVPREKVRVLPPCDQPLRNFVRSSFPSGIKTPPKERTQPAPESDRIIRPVEYWEDDHHPERKEILEDLDAGQIDWARSEDEGWPYSDDDPWEDKVDRIPGGEED